MRYTNFTMFDRQYPKEKQAEGLAISQAIAIGKCNECRFLKQCESDRNFAFPADAYCQKRRQEILKEWGGKGGLSMDYEKLAAAIKLCGSTPKVDQCRECPYWASGDMNNCIPRMTADAATAITDLLARAEAAEARAEKAERDRNKFKQRWAEAVERACELSKIVEENGLEE